MNRRLDDGAKNAIWLTKQANSLTTMSATQIESRADRLDEWCGGGRSSAMTKRQSKEPDSAAMHFRRKSQVAKLGVK